MDNEKVFLSHHSSKAELVRHLSTYLEHESIQTWYAPRDIRSGEEWDESIHQAIKTCRAVVLLFCAQADSSRQVKRELSLADKYKKPVFWLRVEKVEPNQLSYFLTSTQWLDWLDKRDEALIKLTNDILLLTKDEDNSQVEEDTNISDEKIGRKWARGIYAFQTEKEAADCAARLYFEAARIYPESSIILPTGRSATKIFREMVKIAKNMDRDPFGDVQILSDTETFGVTDCSDTSRSKHIREALIEPLEVLGKSPAPEQLHLLTGYYGADDPVKGTQRILRFYPPVIHAVSVSPIGEIIGYDVGTYTNLEDILDDPPRIVTIGEHSKKYIDSNQPSSAIFTIGLGALLSTRILLILAFEVQKANIVHRLFYGPETPGIPATLLREHPNAYLLTTKKVVEEAGILSIIDPGDKAEEVLKCIVEG